MRSSRRSCGRSSKRWTRNIPSPSGTRRISRSSERIANLPAHHDLNLMSDVIRNNTEHNRFELDAEGHTAVALYRLAPGTITIYHTEVDPEVEGRGIGSRLVRASLEEVRKLGLKLIPGCSF